MVVVVPFELADVDRSTNKFRDKASASFTLRKLPALLRRACLPVWRLRLVLSFWTSHVNATHNYVAPRLGSEPNGLGLKSYPIRKSHRHGIPPNIVAKMMNVSAEYRALDNVKICKSWYRGTHAIFRVA